MKGTFELSVNERILVSYGDDFLPSPEKPSFRFTLFVPEFAFGKRSNSFEENFTVYSVELPTEIQFFNFETGFVSFGLRILGFGLGISKQTGY